MAKFKVGDKVSCTYGRKGQLIKTGEVYTVTKSWDTFVKLEEITLASHAYKEDKFELVEEEVERIEYTIPHNKTGGPVTLDNIHEVIKGAVCREEYMGGCGGLSKEAGCPTCVFGHESAGGTKEAFYQMILDIVENDNG